MRIENVLRECWQVSSGIELTPEVIAEKVSSFWSCLKNDFINLSKNDQIDLLSTYLQLIGYRDLIVNLSDNTILLKYTLPGNIHLNGVAQLDDQTRSDAQDWDFLIIYTNRLRGADSVSLPNSKTIKLHLEDMLRHFGLILAINFYRKLESEIRQLEGLNDWFFNYLRIEYEASLEELSLIEKKWNSFSDLKIDKRISVR